MKRSGVYRLTAALLALCLMSAPTAGALTAEQAGALLQAYYVDEIPQSVLEQPTVEAMLEALGDPYTQYFTPEEFSSFNASMSDSSVVGIGVSSTKVDKGIEIVSVLANSPAQEAGLQAGDIIVKVEGQSLAGLTLDEAVALIKGKEGTQVKVTYLREGERRAITLTRATVVVPATTSELIDDHIGYISCTTFGEETYGHFLEAFQNYGGQADVWIVDLRGNSGGLTQAAVDSAGCFIGAEPIVYLRDGEGYYSPFSYDSELSTVAPAIVLTDINSASASELFASAIQDHGAGIIVGTRSFGKGVAQTVLDHSNLPEYFPGEDALKVTSHRFYGYAGNTTDQLGVVPALLVEPSMADTVAYLIAQSYPAADTTGYLRIDFSWQWFVDLKTAAEEFPDGLQALLNALPSGANLYIGTGGSDGWEPVKMAQVAEWSGLEAPSPAFSDLEDSSYPQILTDLKTYGLIRGREDGSYCPKDSLTRAELCQMLTSALNCFLTHNQSPYSDVDDEAWYAPAVLAMTHMGLVKGMDDGKFHPDAPVSHQQLITIMARLACWLNLYLYEDSKALVPEGLELEKLSEYADWAKDSAWLLSDSQRSALGSPIPLLWDAAEQIVPTAPATRDEAAYLLFRILTYTNVLIF